jgi:hypothetical protein
MSRNAESRDGSGWDDLTPFCGPHCSKCPSFVATENNDRSALERIAAEWTQSMGRTFTAADVTCDGCRVEGGRLSAYCAVCEIRACARSKGVPTCAHCGDYPCQRIVAPPAREALDAIKARLKRE